MGTEEETSSNYQSLTDKSPMELKGEIRKLREQVKELEAYKEWFESDEGGKFEEVLDKQKEKYEKKIQHKNEHIEQLSNIAKDRIAKNREKAIKINDLISNTDFYLQERIEKILDAEEDLDEAERFDASELNPFSLLEVEQMMSLSKSVYISERTGLEQQKVQSVLHRDSDYSEEISRLEESLEENDYSFNIGDFEEESQDFMDEKEAELEKLEELQEIYERLDSDFEDLEENYEDGREVGEAMTSYLENLSEDSQLFIEVAEEEEDYRISVPFGKGSGVSKVLSNYFTEISGKIFGEQSTKEKEFFEIQYFDEDGDEVEVEESDETVRAKVYFDKDEVMESQIRKLTQHVQDSKILEPLDINIVLDNMDTFPFSDARRADCFREYAASRRPIDHDMVDETEEIYRELVQEEDREYQDLSDAVLTDRSTFMFRMSQEYENQKVERHLRKLTEAAMVYNESGWI